VPSHPWTSRRDLLLSDRFSRDFVAEIDNNGLAHLRFGDGEYGRRPAPGTGLRVSYRVGLGSGGNVSAGAIAHVVTRDKGITGVRNPLAATGGLDPETASRIRIDAPQAFRTQRRCVTEQDYIDRALLYTEVGSAVASRTWSPSTSLATVTIHIARTDRNPVSLRYCERVRASLLPFAMIGDLLVVRPPDMLPMSLVVSVTTLPGYSFTIVKNQVYAAIDAEMSKTSYEFGQLAQSSRWLAIAAAVPGVDQVQVEVLPVRDSPTPVTAGQEMPTGSPQPSVVSPATIVRFENIQVLNGTPAAAPAAPLPATGVSAS
jgi:predicted phage baseplate assembly protein